MQTYMGFFKDNLVAKLERNGAVACVRLGWTSRPSKERYKVFILEVS